jgi:hypothetical protein
VRAFLPEASKVEAVGERGDVASLAGIHDAGLFAGALPNGPERYQLRAQFGDDVVELEVWSLIGRFPSLTLQLAYPCGGFLPDNTCS